MNFDACAIFVYFSCIFHVFFMFVHAVCLQRSHTRINQVYLNGSKYSVMLEDKNGMLKKT